MSTIDQDRINRGVGSALGLVLGATVRATKVYVEQGLGDEPATGDARRAILSELEVVATALRLADIERDLFGRLTGALDPGPTLAVLRTLQDSLLLALSDDERTRSLRISEKGLRDRLRAEPVRRFLDQGMS
jgi:hypothetical protein